MPRENKGPRLERNHRGIWEIRWTDDRRSKRLSTRSGDIQEAQQILAGFLAERDREQTTGPTVALGVLLDQYLADHVHAGKVTAVSRQEEAIDRLREGFGDDTPVRNIDDQAVARYCHLRRTGAVAGHWKRPAADSTIRRELVAMRAALNLAVRKKRISADDMPHIDMPPESDPREFWLTETEADQLLRIARDRLGRDGRLSRTYRFIALALGTASRKGAIQSLTWDQVDMAQGLIRFDLAGPVRNGGRQVTGKRTKKRRVAVPIAGWLQEVLRQAEQEAVGPLVLDNDRDIRRGLEWACLAAARQTGNARFKEVTPHVLRHTAATHMVRAGIPLWEVAGVLGDTMMTVQRVYAHHCPDHLRSAVGHRAYGQ